FHKLTDLPPGPHQPRQRKLIRILAQHRPPHPALLPRIQRLLLLRTPTTFPGIQRPIPVALERRPPPRHRPQRHPEQLRNLDLSTPGLDRSDHPPPQILLRLRGKPPRIHHPNLRVHTTIMPYLPYGSIEPRLPLTTTFRRSAGEGGVVAVEAAEVVVRRRQRFEEFVLALLDLREHRLRAVDGLRTVGQRGQRVLGQEIEPGEDAVLAAVGPEVPEFGV